MESHPRIFFAAVLVKLGDAEQLRLGHLFLYKSGSLWVKTDMEGSSSFSVIAYLSSIK